ncbi:MAG: hypothetical protein AAF547_08500 [Actinomycetota bacterium]
MSEPFTLTFLTWNLAMLERPAAAPFDWAEEHTQAEIRRIALGESPDVIAFQEVPGVVPYVETHDMVRANPMSHQGNLATLVGNHLVDDGLADVEPADAIVVTGCAVLTVVGPVTVANVHLAPGRAGAETRREQLAAVLDAAPTAAVAVIGDGNARAEEEPTIEALGLRGPRPPAPTWDSRRNRFRAGGPGFVANFTRCWATDEVRIDELAVLNDRTVDVGTGPFHLSDHFPLTGTLTIDAG